ncbi:polyprenyl synthetase family protein [Parabacteroides sp. 52]|uniref:polyprenyl synthetase family protein n=1 Tax=unclassified Parabacteroides TaxID=2649774 RepID=UPI0013D6C7AE|nr:MULTISPECIES: polyprenyl synthetase family protein [unclassified Parabacteroides]MDH6534741.1 octaprenyl-diphosphate synthase [Parabacteroides sp. PM5-20]NDV55747.1 polyprenyl synthetase family protein [Parabacteroides sp. 52]
MEERKRIEAPVVAELKQFHDDFATSLESSTQYLQQAIDVILQASGKHIRPLLVLLAAKACGNVTSETINAAVLLELLHTATLVHDDVVDETKQRRGVPSLNAIYDNRMAVLVGDYLLSSALIRSIQTGDLRIVGIISGLGRDLAEGEIKQLEAAEEVLLDEDRYFQVIRKKTASLLSACTEIGAISAHASDEMIVLLRQFGEYIGYCFQIKDDIFDYDRQTDIGKPTGNDIREGKVTLPLLYALKNGEATAVDKALRIIRAKDFTTENIDELIRFAHQEGGIDYAVKRMKEYQTKAVELLSQLPVSESRESLLLLTDYIIHRHK